MWRYIRVREKGQGRDFNNAIMSKQHVFGIIIILYFIFWCRMSLNILKLSKNGLKLIYTIFLIEITCVTIFDLLFLRFYVSLFAQNNFSVD